MRNSVMLMIVGLAAVAGCRGADSNSFRLLNDVAHYPRVPITAVVDTDRAVGLGPAGLSGLSLVETIDLATEFGSLRGHAEDLVALKDDSLLVIDRRMLGLMRLGTDRVLRPAIDRAEDDYRIHQPVSVAVVDEGTILVADRTTRLKLLETRDGTLVPRSVIEIGYSADDACSVGGRLLVRGLTTGGKTIAEYNDRGEMVRAYGPGYQHSSPLVVGQLSTGVIGCGRELETVVTFAHPFPLIQGYSLDGELAWTTEIRGLKLAKFEHGKTKFGAESVRRARDSVFDHPYTLIGIGDGKLLFQYVRVSQPSPTERAFEVHSVLLSSASGQGSYLGTELPLVRESAKSRLYTVSPQGSAIKTYALTN